MVVVVTGNHYLLDILAGILIALITLVIAHRIPRRGRDDRIRREGSGRSARRPISPG